MSADHQAAWPAWPTYDREQVDAAAKVLETGRVNYWNGSVGRQLEQDFARWLGTEYSIAVSNGSVSLDLILEALKISAEVVENLPMRDAVTEASVRVREGAAISKSLAASKLFPPMMIHLVSSGETVRGSMISMEMPCMANCSAASIVRCTISEMATTVRSSPARTTLARPKGIS